MYISLHTAQQLKRLKDRLLWYGLFLVSGGGAALLYNTALQDAVRWGWAMAALVFFCAGLYLILLATGRARINNTYVTITPTCISYRLHFFSGECIVVWQQVAGIQLNQNCVLFNLRSGVQKTLNLSAISSPNIASWVAISVHEAALERNLHVNSFQALVPGTANSIY